MAIELIDKIKPKNNGSFALVDAADVALPNGKRLDEALSDMAGGSASVPVFDLVALGLPAIPKSGAVVTVATDTTEIVAGLASGSVFFTVQIAEDDTPATHKLLMNPDESSAGMYGCVFQMTHAENLTVIVIPNSIMAFWSTMNDHILPAVTSSDNGKIAGVVNGKWAAATPDTSGSGSGGESSGAPGSVMWKDIIDRPFEVLENGTVIPLDNRFLEPLETTIREIDLFPESTVDGFALDETYGAYTPGFSSAGTFTPEPLGTYNVVWDGMFYTCNSFTFEVEGDTFVGLGNGAYVGQTGHDEPFLIAYTPAYGMKQFFANTTETSHTIRVYQTAPAYRLRADYLPMDAIKTYIDDYMSDALGGDY